jgi:hypothetical protein
MGGSHCRVVGIVGVGVGMEVVAHSDGEMADHLTWEEQVVWEQCDLSHLPVEEDSPVPDTTETYEDSKRAAVGYRQVVSPVVHLPHHY